MLVLEQGWNIHQEVGQGNCFLSKASAVAVAVVVAAEVAGQRNPCCHC